MKSDWIKIIKYFGVVSFLYDFCVDAYFDEGLNELLVIILIVI